jgi:hypothetical protein
MHFTNTRSIIKPNVEKIQPKKLNNILMDRIQRQVVPTRPKSVIPNPIATVNTTKDAMLWGAPTWYFFHTLAEKIKPEYFETNKNTLFNIIKSICSNLPCPSCSLHATQYINNIQLNSIKCKEDFIMLFFNFHNEVNRRKNKPKFSYDELRTKYAKANLINIINHFIYYYKMEHHAIRMMTDDFHRKRLSKNIIDMLHSKIHIFEK